MSTNPTTLVRHLRSLAVKQAMGDWSDQQLLEAFLTQRSEASFAALVRRHGPMVLSVCRRVLRNSHDAEDAFQATFLLFARKAASIRKQQSLGSWLHSVAFHTAEKLKRTAARQAARERNQARDRADDPMEKITWRELRSVLDEELAKLPEQYRAPLVLCYLEGKTRDEAARHLGWTTAVFRRRLEQGRARLGVLLRHRGLTLSAALSAPLLAEATAPAMVPPLLADSTVRAGLALAMGQAADGLVPAQVAALANGGTKTLLAGKGKWAIALLLAMSMAAGGVFTRQTPATLSVAMQPAVSPLAPPANSPPEAAIEEKGDTIAVGGRVLDPDGKPFSGAKIYLIGSGDRPKKHPVRAVSGPDGRFHFTFPKKEYFETDWIRIRAEMWRWCDLVAEAPGYSPVNQYMADIKKDLILRLVKDVRIDGRVRDLEGRPVAGAEVRAIGSSWSSLLSAAITDKEGRFSLAGVGRGREEELRISAPAMETKWVKVKTPVEGPAAVEVLAAPTKPIEGTVRARDTGKPLAGVKVWAKLNGWPRGEDDSHLLRTVTDDQGRYRLLGLPKAQRYELTVVPPVESGYVITAKQAEDSAGLDPIRLDFDLARGTIVRFRLIDKETGRPVRGGVQYSPLTDSPYWAEATRLEPGVLPPRVFFYMHATERDHSIQFVAYPGPGLICAHAGWGNRRYLNARLDPEDEKNGHYPGMKGDPLNGFALIVPGYRRIDPKPTARQLVFDIVLDPGRSLKGTVVDPAGRPVDGATVWGLGVSVMPQRTLQQGEQILESAAFTAAGMERDKAYTLVFVHRGRKLIGQQVMRPEDKSPLTVRLAPWGTLTGRLVDTDGKPLADVKVRLKYPNSLGSVIPDSISAVKHAENLEFATDRDGRFSVEGLLPNLDHELILAPASKPNGALAGSDSLKKLKTREGEKKDLGDITVKVVPLPNKEKKNG
jgi:RNA polymerase sigma factor (sigma-70 family)